MNHKLDKDTPRFDVQLLFDELGVLLDDNQYRDVISLIDMYHFYIRQYQVIIHCGIWTAVWINMMLRCSTKSIDQVLRNLPKTNHEPCYVLQEELSSMKFMSASINGLGIILKRDA